MDPDTTQDFATRVLVLYDESVGAPEWLRDLTRTLDRFGLQLATRSLGGVSSVQSLLRGHRFCVFVLVENTEHGPDLRLKWQTAFQQVAGDTQLLRVVDEHAIADVIGDAVLSDIERIAARLRRQRAATVRPGPDAMLLGYDLED